ncbi:hypothetical protein Goarm_005348, partial [Gossypium armourianum]|nr:hypothetical protein [Gossypium armourianum]
GNPNASPFPSNFLFGTASSSYQFEGAFLSDGKGLNNWDVFTHKPGNIMDGSNGDTAVDHYHLYQAIEDLDLMQDIGVNSYRFSISWARILPKGRFGSVNKAGIHHYNKLINTLLLTGLSLVPLYVTQVRVSPMYLEDLTFCVTGIQPFVSLTHYDIPQELENRYGAWLSSQVQEDFKYHADICFKYFGDRVKYWTTFNEPNVAVIRGYRSGIYPPSRCSSSFGNCSNGDSEKEPFIAAHNIILSHAAAVDVYRTKYQKQQGGSIGIVMNAIWYEPISNSLKDKQAAERAQAFYMNWFLDPIIMGKYPKEMQEILDSNLPSFSNHDQEKLNSTGLDFIGINHYTSFYTKDCMFSVCEQGPGNTKTEGFALRTATKNGVFIGESTALDWLFVHPQGMEKIITYVKERYNNIPMFITENGFCENDKSDSLTEETVNDVNRVEYISGYLVALGAALRKGADVRGYFLWSLLDNFEWTLGFTIRFGLHHVDFSTLKRTPRGSATWYKQFIANHTAEKILMPQHYPGNQLGQHFNTI